MGSKGQPPRHGYDTEPETRRIFIRPSERSLHILSSTTRKFMLPKPRARLQASVRIGYYLVPPTDRRPIQVDHGTPHMEMIRTGYPLYVHH